MSYSKMTTQFLLVSVSTSGALIRLLDIFLLNSLFMLPSLGLGLFENQNNFRHLHVLVNKSFKALCSANHFLGPSQMHKRLWDLKTYVRFEQTLGLNPFSWFDVLKFSNPTVLYSKQLWDFHNEWKDIMILRMSKQF